LYRIGQEAIANAVQHARPATITLTLVYEWSVVRLTITDDGVGFAPGGDLQGFGLSGMRKRAAGISARFRIVSAPGAGTSIQVIAPLPPPITWKSWPRVYFKYLKEYRPHGTAAELSHQDPHHR
jgi:glucose-6-phosphate-specific signal transduction histidine kinase